MSLAPVPDEQQSEQSSPPIVRGRRAQQPQQTVGTPVEPQSVWSLEPVSAPVSSIPVSSNAQNRTPVPGYDGSSFRSRAEYSEATHSGAANTEPAHTEPAHQARSEDSQPYTAHDFSPERRRATFTDEPSRDWLPPKTLGAASTDADSTSPASTDSVHAESVSVDTSTIQTITDADGSVRRLTRRELRALEHDSEQTFDAPPASPRSAAEPIRPRNRAVLTESEPEPPVLVEPAVLVQPPVVVEPPVLEEPPVLVEPALSAPPAIVEPPALVELPASVELPALVEPTLSEPRGAFSFFRNQSAQPTQVEKVAGPTEVEAEVIHAEVVQAEVIQPDFDALLAQPQAPANVDPIDVQPVPAADDTVEKVFALEFDEPDDGPEELPITGSFSLPVGHWSTQALIDDDEQVEIPFGRDIGVTSGAITTSALVLPSIPTVDDILSPLSSTGEIMITGSINLPSSLGTTGALPARYDHSDVDTLLAADDREDSNTESAPVRAIRAVSTHTASGPVITTGKPKGMSRLPVILMASGGVAGVGVAVIAVLTLVFKVF